MRGLGPPPADIWRKRNDWFWRAHDVNAGPQPLDLDPRAGALLAELELLFCAGAWASTVIVAWTLVEASLRRTARNDAARAPDADWLREQRNGLVHLGGPIPQEGPDELAMETLAQGAVRVVFKTLFAAAWMGTR